MFRSAFVFIRQQFHDHFSGLPVVVSFSHIPLLLLSLVLEVHRDKTILFMWVLAMYCSESFHFSFHHSLFFDTDIISLQKSSPIVRSPCCLLSFSLFHAVLSLTFSPPFNRSFLFLMLIVFPLCICIHLKKVFKILNKKWHNIVTHISSVTLFIIMMSNLIVFVLSTLDLFDTDSEREKKSSFSPLFSYHCVNYSYSCW